jgi:hypothetical protein
MAKKREYNPATRRMEIVEEVAAPKATIGGMASGLLDVVVSTSKLIMRGEPAMASDEVVAERKAICVACVNWDARGYGGLGKCNACGCSGFKIKVAASKCPQFKWPR